MGTQKEVDEQRKIRARLTGEERAMLRDEAARLIADLVEDEVLRQNDDDRGLDVAQWTELLRMGKPQKDERSVDRMTAFEQIERLAVQRNTLWRMLCEVARWLPDKQNEELREFLWSIVGNAYAVEGVNPTTHDEDGEVSLTEAAAPYTRAAKKVRENW